RFLHVLETLNRTIQIIQCTAVFFMRTITGIFQASESIVDGIHRFTSVIWKRRRRGVVLRRCFICWRLISIAIIFINDVDVLNRIRINTYLLQRSVNGWCIANASLIGNEYAQQLRECRFLILTLGVNWLQVKNLSATHWQCQQVTVVQVIRTTPQGHVTSDLVRRHHRILRLLWALSLGVGWQYANGNVTVAFWV